MIIRLIITFDTPTIVLESEMYHMIRIQKNHPGNNRFIVSATFSNFLILEIYSLLTFKQFVVICVINAHITSLNSMMINFVAYFLSKCLDYFPLWIVIKRLSGENRFAIKYIAMNILYMQMI